MPLNIPESLIPPEVRRTRALLRRTSWIPPISWGIAAHFAFAGLMVPLMMLMFADGFGEVALVLAVAGAGVTLPVSAAAAVTALWTRWTHARTERVQDWWVVVRDPRWDAALDSLRRLKGEDPDGVRDRQVFALTLALAEEMQRHDTLRALCTPPHGFPVGQDLARTYEAHAGALDRFLSALAETARTPEPEVTPALERAHQELRAIVAADAEVAGRRPFGRVSASSSG